MPKFKSTPKRSQLEKDCIIKGLSDLSSSMTSKTCPMAAHSRPHMTRSRLKEVEDRNKSDKDGPRGGESKDQRGREGGNRHPLVAIQNIHEDDIVNTTSSDSDHDRPIIRTRSNRSRAIIATSESEGDTDGKDINYSSSSSSSNSSSSSSSSSSSDDEVQVDETFTADDEVCFESCNEKKSPLIIQIDSKVDSKVASSNDRRLGVYITKHSLSTFSKHSISEDIIEDYFTGKGRSLSCMYPHIDPVLYEQLANTNVTPCQTSLEALHAMHHEFFDYWLCLMVAGFNVLLHGLGSKLKLLDDFRLSKLSKSYQVVMFGFFPDQSLKYVLQEMIVDILECSNKFKSTLDQSRFICSKLCQKTSPIKEIYFIIHNIDAPPLQDPIIQSSLSHLANCPHIHMIASIDHPRSPLLWNELSLARFNWVWYNAPTYISYSTELSYKKTTKASDDFKLNSFQHVMAGLTPNARGIFKLLATHQLNHKDDTSHVGMKFADFYKKCRENFLVNSEISLRSQLTEFCDHKLIGYKDSNGTQVLVILIDHQSLEQLINED